MISSTANDAVIPPPVEQTACPLCGRSANSAGFEAVDRLYRLPGKFAFVPCECGAVYLSPRPVLSGLGFYYPAADYYSYSTPISQANVRDRGPLGRLRDEIRSATLERWGYPVPPVSSLTRAMAPVLTRLLAGPALYGMAHRFPRYRAGGRALDVGCGNGSYLSYLKHHGWKVAGVELSGAAAAAAKQKFDIDVFVGDLADAPYEPASFDFIHLSHVLEHLPDPVHTLKTIRRLLKADGQVYIETPNCAAWSIGFCRQYWFHWDAPRHLVLFSPKTLRLGVEKAGMTVKRMWTSPHENLFAWEDTYRAEDAGLSVAPRPSLRPARVPRAIALRLGRRIVKSFAPLTAELLCCTAALPNHRQV